MGGGLSIDSELAAELDKPDDASDMIDKTQDELLNEISKLRILLKAKVPQTLSILLIREFPPPNLLIDTGYGCAKDGPS